MADLPRTPPVAVRATPRWDGGPTASSLPTPESRPSRPAAHTDGAPGSGPARAEGDQRATAGAVWTGAAAGGGAWSSGPTEIVLCFETGATTEAVRRLLAAGVDLRDFSVARLVAESAERLPEDPWSLDIERVVTAIGARSMRETYVRPRATNPVSLTAPPGRWHGFSPFGRPVEGAERWPDLPVGVSVFSSEDGRRWIVEVDDEGRAWQGSAPP